MKYFDIDEFKCKCGCGINNMSPITLGKIDLARRYAGIPFIVNSACRCYERNKEEGGREDSSHITSEFEECEAVDIKVVSGRDRFIIANAMLRAGFSRIGVAKSFIHCDSDSKKDPNVCWVY